MERGWSRRGFLRGAALSLGAGLGAAGLGAIGARRAWGAGLAPGRPTDVQVAPGWAWRRVAAVGDRISAGGDRFGFDADYTCWLPLGEAGSADRALVWVNHEFPPGPLGSARLDRVVGAWTGKRAGPDDLMAGMGGSVVEVARHPEGGWALVADSARAWRLSGLGPETTVTGAGGAILGAGVAGTISNCGGGLTPWGTILTCEENHRYHAAEGLGSRTGKIGAAASKVASGGFSIPGLISERYGWVVEVDPRDPGWQPRRHTALARLRHESAAVRAEEGQPLRIYMPEDRAGGGIWRYTSRKPWRSRLSRERGSRLLEEGTLEIARLEPGGAMRWIPVHHAAPIDMGRREALLRLGERWGVDPGFLTDLVRAATLADLYETPAALLVDAFVAGFLAGGTPLGRPEGAVWDGSPLSPALYVALTTASGLDPSDPNAPPVDHAAGSILRLTDGAAPAWSVHTLAGRDFASPDNLGLDHAGRLLVATDAETPGAEGHNSLCAFQPPAQDRPGAWERLLIAPPEAEVCGPSTAEGGALFCAIQHPVEAWGESTLINLWPEGA